MGAPNQPNPPSSRIAQARLHREAALRRQDLAGTPHAVYSDAELKVLKQAAAEAGVRISVREATEDDR